MQDVLIFKRIEKKYRINRDTRKRLLSLISERLIPDSHGKSRVYSLYLDTPDYRLIRESITAGVYKEKLRLRSYGEPKADGKVFLEIKKKYKGVVYKRREVMQFCTAFDYITSGRKPYDSQILREIDYAMHCYGSLCPKMLITCEREAYFSLENPDLRLTFDRDIRYKNQEFSFSPDGKPIIGDDEYILEVKSGGGVPLWLSRALSECEIFPAPFSKYGTAYKDLNFLI